MSAVADKLREARALIESGWTQRYYDNGEGCVCSLGAICKATTGQAVPGGRYTTKQRAMIRALADAVACPNLIGWNDAPERTRADVLDAFDKAIALAEQEKAR